MKRNLLVVALLLTIATIGCPKKPAQTSLAAPAGQPAAAAPTTPPPAVQPAPQPTPQPMYQPAAGPAKPNLSLTLSVKFLQEILGGLCTTGYQIYLGDPSNYIIFRELKYLQNLPGQGEIELAMKLDFSVKKMGMRYADTAEAVLRLKLSTAKKNNKVMLVGSGRAIAIKTSFGPTMDENFLLPRLNKEISKAPLFEVPLSDIAHVLIPWPKLGDSARITELNLNDATIEIQQVATIIHMSLATQTRKPQ